MVRSDWFQKLFRTPSPVVEMSLSGAQWPMGTNLCHLDVTHDYEKNNDIPSVGTFESLNFLLSILLTILDTLQVFDFGENLQRTLDSLLEMDGCTTK